MRSKLKKLAFKVQNEGLNYYEVEVAFKSWMGSYYKLMSKEQRLGMLSLYEDLFDKNIEIVKGDMIITDRNEEH
jgi:ABC-type transporter MlaC component